MKKILCTAVLLLTYMIGANAQPIMDGEVVVSNFAVSRTGGSLFVSMDLDVSGLDVKNNREIVLTPAIALGDNSRKLPSVIIAGRQRYYLYLRNGVPADCMALYRSGQTATVEYRTVTEYEQWMGNAEVRVNEMLCGCLNTPLTQANEPLASLDLEPKKFRPSFVYIRPKAEPKINTLEGSAYIDFPVNRTEIYADYRRNPIELQSIRSTIDAVKNDSDTKITALTIKGYASPEGSYANNTRLAKGRTEALKEYVRELYAFPESLMSTAYEPEDWEGLERFVEKSTLDNRAGILDIIHSDLAPDAKDAKIKSTYPADYAYLLQNVYPALRHSDYTVVYEVRAYTDVEEIKRLLKTQPQKLSLEEMYLAAQTMETGSDEYNETFEIAVRMFPDDAVANLNAANTAMRLGDMNNAGRYLAKAGDSPEAVYARGMMAALNGDYETAKELVGKAASMGIKDNTDDILKQLDEILKYSRKQ